MDQSNGIWRKPADYIRAVSPENPVLFFSPADLQARAAKFIAGFPGMVTYAVKANSDEAVLNNLSAAGINGFDVASPTEIDLVRALAPLAALHYNNPVRSVHEIEHAARAGVKSYAVDSWSEIAKLAQILPADGVELSVRFKLPVTGAAYDFGAKFGATAQDASALLAHVAKLGYTPSLAFHPGTQCHDPMAWDAYIRAAGDIASAAGVTIKRLNVGGGFASHRQSAIAPNIEKIFALIGRVSREVFGDNGPDLICEPGRGMVGDSFALCARVKAVRDGGHIFLNDGIYGGLAEHSVMGNIDRIEVLTPKGSARRSALKNRTVFGPTCDSIDRLPDEIPLPRDIAEGDYLIVHSMGAYSTSLATRFNGYGALAIETVRQLSA